MMEDDVRAALEHRATQVEPEADWDDLVDRLERRREWVPRAVGVAACLTLLVSIVAALRLTGSDVNVASGPTTNSGAPPAEFVAATRDGDVVVADSSTGRVLRTLFVGSRQRYAREVALSPDRRTVFATLVGEAQTCPTWHIVRLSFEGGPPEPVAERAHAAVVSPDGTRLAFFGGERGPCGQGRTLIVRDLASGAERRWTDRACSCSGPVSWSPDSRELAYSGRDVRVLDITTGLDTADGRKLGPASSDGGLWDSPTYASADELWVQEHRSSPTAEGFTNVWRVLSIDPKTGRRYRVVLDLAGFRDPAVVSQADLALDRSGRHALVFASDDRLTTTLYRWAAGKLLVIGTGFVDADW